MDLAGSRCQVFAGLAHHKEPGSNRKFLGRGTYVCLMDMVEKNSNHFQKVDVRAADVSQMSLEFSHFLKFEQAKNLYQYV